jgi:hypothetical protein
LNGPDGIIIQTNNLSKSYDGVAAMLWQFERLEF